MCYTTLGPIFSNGIRTRLWLVRQACWLFPRILATPVSTISLFFLNLKLVQALASHIFKSPGIFTWMWGVRLVRRSPILSGAALTVMNTRVAEVDIVEWRAKWLISRTKVFAKWIESPQFSFLFDLWFSPPFPCSKTSFGSVCFNTKVQ